MTDDTSVMTLGSKGLIILELKHAEVDSSAMSMNLKNLIF